MSPGHYGMVRPWRRLLSDMEGSCEYTERVGTYANPPLTYLQATMCYAKFEQDSLKNNNYVAIYLSYIIGVGDKKKESTSVLSIV
jgi:hypothetical protein